MLDNKPYTFDRIFRSAMTVGGICAVIWLFSYLSEALIPFALAFLLAYLINPLVCQLQKKIKHRMAAVFITLVGLGVALLLSSYFVLKPVKTEFKNMKETVARASHNPRLDKLRMKVNQWGAIVKKEQQTDMLNLLMKSEKHQKIGKELLGRIFPVAKGMFGGVFRTMWALVLGLLGVTVVVLYLIFILADYQAVKEDWKELIPGNWKKPITDFVLEFDKIMNQHFRAQAVVAILVGVLFAIGFSLIGLPMAILLGLFVGALNMIPYLQLVGLLPAAVLAVMMALDSEGSVATALIKTGSVFVVVQLIQDAVLVPRIMGKVTGLKPAIILLSISIWGQLLGFLGLLIALPMTCLVLAYYRKFILKH